VATQQFDCGCKLVNWFVIIFAFAALGGRRERRSYRGSTERSKLHVDVF